MEHQWWLLQLWHGACAVAGAGLLWLRWSKKNHLAFWRVSTLLRQWIGAGFKADALEFLIFVGFGTFISLAVIEADTCGEAFSAGVGWTALTAQVTLGQKADANAKQA